MRILLTGAAGFIGSHLRETFIEAGHEVIGLDNFSTGSNPDNIKSYPDYPVVRGDIRNSDLIHNLLSGFSKYGKFQGVLHAAAETHVDRSITNPLSFIDTNVMGTANLLEQSYLNDIERFHYISTDEVYGSATFDQKEPFTEDSPLLPNSPYAASKASGDNLCRAFFKTYELPVIVTRCTNNFGPRQLEEKLIPKVIRLATLDKEIPVYGNGKQMRDWIYVEDHCSKVLEVFTRGTPGEVYNIDGKVELSNLFLIRCILGILKKPESLIKHILDRPGHDVRYYITSKHETFFLDFVPSFLCFADELEYTVEKYLEVYCGTST